MLTLALSKGRILDETEPLLRAVGLRLLDDPEQSRKLILQTESTGDLPAIRVIVVRASDVPTYVEYGAADFGIAGLDVLIEHEGSGLYRPVDLEIGRCRLCVAAKAGFDYSHAVRAGQRIRVASKYVKSARKHFAAKGMHVDLIKLYGSMELAPLVGLADVIVDLVSTGNTLKANQLVEVETVYPVSARLIVNQAALKTRRSSLDPVINAFASAVKALRGDSSPALQMKA